MNRLLIIRELLKHKKFNHYLEIGVFNGHNFFRVKSTFKIAVDPYFRASALRRLFKTLLNPFNLYNRYFEKSSDDFFREDAPKVFADRMVDIALIDGMHTYDFVLRDVENTLRYLQPEGVILLHDCNPLTPEAACSYQDWERRDFKGVWNGDVWKIIVHLRSMRPDLNVFVLDCDNGVGVVTRRKHGSEMLGFTQEQISRLWYADFDANRKEWLNLQPPAYFYTYFGIRPPGSL